MVEPTRGSGQRPGDRPLDDLLENGTYAEVVAAVKHAFAAGAEVFAERREVLSRGGAEKNPNKRRSPTTPPPSTLLDHVLDYAFGSAPARFRDWREAFEHCPAIELTRPLLERLAVHRDTRIQVSAAGGWELPETPHGPIALDREALALLRVFASPTSLAEAVPLLAPDLGEHDVARVRALVRQWRDRGVLIEADRASVPRSTQSPYFRAYERPAHQRMMLLDSIRTRAFERALTQVVDSSSVVVDVGSGTGILSMFAARAGAAKVYAVEGAQVARTSSRIIAANGLDDRIQVIQGRSEAIELPEKADVIVSEWLGVLAMHERMFESFVAVRDRWLAEGGCCVPASVRIWLAPLEDGALAVRLGDAFWKRRRYGFDFSAMLELEDARRSIRMAPVSPPSYLCDPELVATIDCTTDDIAAFYYDGTVEFEIGKRGCVDGFAGHFDCELAPGVVLDTSPFSGQTHWRQAYLAFDPIHVEPGDRIGANLVLDRPSDPRQRELDQRLTVEHFRAGQRLGRYERVYHSYA